MATSVFGYGSLIFKPPPFKNIISEAGYIKNYVRRFAQDSHDHRGTPENPGRVVTLVTAEDWEPYRRDDPLSENNIVWGTIYSIPVEQSTEIWSYLDHREKDGYTIRLVDVFARKPMTGEEYILKSNCRVYVGESHNSSFQKTGTPMNELADRISTAVGPSGPNKFYLYNLCDSVKQLCPESEDSYLNLLEKLVKERDRDIDV